MSQACHCIDHFFGKENEVYMCLSKRLGVCGFYL
jgi:hypothetical protein